MKKETTKDSRKGQEKLSEGKKIIWETIFIKKILELERGRQEEKQKNDL